LLSLQVTAGCLWCPLFDESNFDENIDHVIQQIRKCLPDVADAPSAQTAGSSLVTEPNGGEALFSIDEMRAELQRLRAELSTAQHAPTQGLDGRCNLPAAVPEVPIGIQVSEQMHLLVRTVVAPDSRLRVGFHGTGGIGATIGTCHMLIRHCGLAEMRLCFVVLVLILMMPSR
jgi:hypothetical protein